MHTRRDFLKTTMAAGAGALAADAHVVAEAATTSLFPGFQSRSIALAHRTIDVLVAGRGVPLLLLHGHPQTHVEWHKLAPRLAPRFAVVIPDLRVYGDDQGADDGAAAAPTQAIARDQIELMRTLGHDPFAVVGHDRGARVAWRIAAEYPASVTRTALMDIVPGVNSDAEADGNGRRLASPLLVLWGARGRIGRRDDVLSIWREHATDVRGVSLPGGRFLPQELPDQTLAALLPFLSV